MKTLLNEGSNMHKGTLLQEDTFTQRYFFMKTLLHESKKKTKKKHFENNL